MRNIVIPLFNQVLLLDVSGPAEVFSLANRFITNEDYYKIITVAGSAEPIQASNGIRLLADQSFELEIENPHIILVPGGPGAYNVQQPELINWLNLQTKRAKLYGSICTGAFILGRAGLLDGKESTTHWNYTKRLVEEFPSTRVAEDKITTRDGNLFCSGGITTGIDLALELVEEEHGRCVAVNVSKTMLLNKFRHGGQLQFNPATPDLLPEKSHLCPLVEYIKLHLTKKITVADLAHVAQLSVRQLTRRFAQETQMSPMEFVQSIRLDHARLLLETTDAPLKTLAYQCGFGCVRQLTDLFKKRLGITPLQYRQQFR
jgi:transcriptional regulator GlxA family with amidase domain